jgi:spermidine synthase
MDDKPQPLPEGGGDSCKTSGAARLPVLLLAAISFSSGAAVMVVELAAARMLTPYFGQSVFVWTNVIGVILAAIALGNYAGGRLADVFQSIRPLFVILFFAGTLCIAAPWLIRVVSPFFLGENLHLEEAFSLLVRGSFATTLLVFAPPVLLLGMTLPFIVREAARTYGSVGRASGSIYAASTLGSILGTFLTTYVLVEAIGSSGTFYCAGCFLNLIAGGGFFYFCRLPLKVVGAGLIIGSLFFGGLDLFSLQSLPGESCWEKESRYQYVRVVKIDDAPLTYHLCINEGLDSFHSIYREGDVLTDGQYFDYYSLLPALAGKEEAGDVCIIGLAAGTIARQYAHFFGKRGGLAIDGVEIDPAVIEAGYRFMDLARADPWLTVFDDVDGRIFLQSVAKSYDVIIVDAYARQVYIPFQLATREFFEILRDRLAEDGILGINVGGFDRREAVIRAIANTAASVFESVSLARIPESRNFMLYAVRGKGHVDPASCPPELLPPELRPLLENISVYGLTRSVSFDEAEPVLTDDHAPLEMMSDRCLMERSRALVESLPDSG